jgi:alpha-1,6-mannosyltransferase
MSSYMKICDLTQFYSPVSGGVKRYVHEKIAHLQQRGVDEHVLIIPGEKDETLTAERSKIYSIRSPLVSRTARYRALLRLNAVERILETEMPDIIESGDPYQIAWKAIASGSALRIPVVGFYHSHFPEAYLRSAGKFFGRTATEFVMDMAQRYVRSLYNRFARTLVPSPALGQVLAGWGVKNVANIDLGVNTAIFRPEPDDSIETRAELSIPRERVLLLYVGRLAPEKNTRTLFDAFAMLARETPGRFHLLAVGDGPQREFLRDVENTTRAVTWLPYCAEPARLARLYRAADIFVHPGVQETFGLVALESQACGTPVIGIRGSYMDRIICAGHANWARENSPAALAAAIAQLSWQDAAALGAAASREVLARYSWTNVFDRLFFIYREVVTAYKTRTDG